MRAKIIAGNLVAVLLLGLSSYLVLQTKLTSILGSRAESEIESDGTLFDRSWRLSGLDLLRYVEEQAQSQEFVSVFAGLDESSRRTRAFDSAERAAQWFGDSGRRGTPPDLVIVTDETGKVLARNADRNRMYGQLLPQELPALRTVLQKGVTSIDVWTKADDAKILQTAMAPIRGDQNNIIGALVVAYDISNGFAQREAKTLGADSDVAVIVEGKIYSSSLTSDRSSQLKEFLFGDATKSATQSAIAGTPGASTWQTVLGGDKYTGRIAPLANSISTHAAYAVLRDRTAATKPASETSVILIIMVIIAFMVVLYGFAIGSSFLQPLEQIEETLLAIINGRTDLRLDIEHPEFGGLAYRINQLLNVFTGVQEDTDEEDEEGRFSRPPDAAAWKDQAFSDTGASLPATGAANEAIEDPAIAAKLEAEPEAAYFSRVYRDFVAQKQALGENVSNMTEEKFIQRLKGSAEAHMKKYNCRMIRYQIETIDNSVQVRPVVIR